MITIKVFVIIIAGLFPIYVGLGWEQNQHTYARYIILTSILVSGAVRFVETIKYLKKIE